MIIAHIHPAHFTNDINDAPTINCEMIVFCETEEQAKILTEMNNGWGTIIEPSEIKQGFDLWLEARKHHALLSALKNDKKTLLLIDDNYKQNVTTARLMLELADQFNERVA